MGLHILQVVINIVEIGGDDLALIWFGRSVILSADFNGCLPVLALKIDHEILEIVHLVHIFGQILLIELKSGLPVKAEVLVDKFIKCLLFKYQITHLSRKSLSFVIVLADCFLNVSEKL